MAGEAGGVGRSVDDARADPPKPRRVLRRMPAPRATAPARVPRIRTPVPDEAPALAEARSDERTAAPASSQSSWSEAH